jgi:hypothetical protein
VLVPNQFPWVRIPPLPPLQNPAFVPGFLLNPIDSRLAFSYIQIISKGVHHMAFLRTAFPSIDNVKTYATAENALKAFKKALEAQGVDDKECITYDIRPVGERFAVIFFPTEKQVQLGINLAHTSNTSIFRT